MCVRRKGAGISELNCVPGGVNGCQNIVAPQDVTLVACYPSTAKLYNSATANHVFGCPMCYQNLDIIQYKIIVKLEATSKVIRAQPFHSPSDGT